MTMPEPSLRVDGFTVARGLVSDADAARLVSELSRISGLPADHLAGGDEDGQPAYYEHGGVAAHPSLWSVLVHPDLVAVMHNP